MATQAEIKDTIYQLRKWWTKGYEPSNYVTSILLSLTDSVSFSSHTHDIYLTDAPSDSNEYVRLNGAWSIASGGGGGITDHGALTGLADDDHSQYHTDARALTWLGTRSTTDLAEGINLYYTEARVSANVSVVANTAKVSFPGFTDLLTDYGFTDNSANWNLAYGWGDHSLVGYLTSYTETNDLTSAVTWANVPDANITQSAVTQHQAALSITESQISDLGSYLTSEADTWATVTARGATTGTPLTHAYTGADGTQPFVIDASGSSVNNTPVFGMRTPATGARKAFQAHKGADNFAWASFEYGTYPGLWLGPGGASSRDVGFERTGTNQATITATAGVIVDGIQMGGNLVNDILISTDGASTSDSVLVTPGWIDTNVTAGAGASQLSDLSDVVSATNTNRFALMANGTTGYVGRALVEADISDLGSYVTTGSTFYTYETIWAEENGALSTGTASGDQFSFGNGATESELVIGYDCEIYTVALSCQESTTATITVYKNGSATTATCSLSAQTSNNNVLGTPVSVSAGDRIKFRTTSYTSGGTTKNVASLTLRKLHTL